MSGKGAKPNRMIRKDKDAIPIVVKQRPRLPLNMVRRPLKKQRMHRVQT